MTSDSNAATTHSPEHVPFRNAVDPAAAAAYRAAGWWGDTALVDHLRRHVAAQPDAPAYIADGGRLSWSELDVVSDLVAGVVCDLGIEPGTRVAVLLPDGATVQAVYLGLEKAGVVVVGIGARAGDREVAHLLSTTGATILVTLTEPDTRPGADRRDALERLGISLTCHIEVPVFESGTDSPVLIDGRLAPRAEPRSFDDRRIGPDDLFFINSTSGTTGLPKCVLHHQNRWLYFHQKAADHGEFEGDEVMLSVVPAPSGSVSGPHTSP